MASPGPANSLLSRASFANGDERLYSRESTYLLYSPDYKDFGSPRILWPPETPSPDLNVRRSERDWDVETVRDFDGQRKDRENDQSDLRYDGYVRSLQEENQRLEEEMRRKVEEAKQREDEISRKDEQVKKTHQELQKMQEAKRMVEKELEKLEEATRKGREMIKKGQDANRNNEELLMEGRREINKREEEMTNQEKEDAETTRLKHEALKAKEQDIEERERAIKVREEELERREDETKKLGQDLRKKEEEIRRKEEQWKRQEAATLTDMEKTRTLQKEAYRQPEVVQKGISPAQEIVERFNRQRLGADESAYRDRDFRRNMSSAAVVLPPVLEDDLKITLPPPHELVPPAAAWPQSSSAIPHRDRRIEADDSAVREREPRRTKAIDTVVLPPDNYIPVLNPDTQVNLPPPHELVPPAWPWSSTPPYWDRQVEAEEFALRERERGFTDNFIPFHHADTRVPLPPPHELVPPAPWSSSVIPHWDRQVEAKEFAIIERERSLKFGQPKQISLEKSTKSKPLPNTKTRLPHSRSRPSDPVVVVPPLPKVLPQPAEGVWPLLSTSSDGDQRVGYPPIDHHKDQTSRLNRISKWRTTIINDVETLRQDERMAQKNEEAWRLREEALRMDEEDA